MCSTRRRCRLTLYLQAGEAVGSDSMSKSGQKQHASGEAETTTAKAEGYISGAMDNVKVGLFSFSL